MAVAGAAYGAVVLMTIDAAIQNGQVPTAVRAGGALVRRASRAYHVRQLAGRAESTSDSALTGTAPTLEGSF